MKKIVTALGNNILNQELRKYSEYDILCDDIFYQDALIEYVSQNKTDCIIVSGLLQGAFSITEFALAIKNANITARIIIIVDNISEEDKNIIISKGIFDIYRDDDIEIVDIIEAINREEPINLKAQLEKEIQKLKNKNSSSNENSNNITSFESLKTVVQKQEIISIFGTPGSGKSTIAYNLAKNLSKNSYNKVLLIDLDTINGNLNEIIGVDKVNEKIDLLIDEDKKCGINYCADLILKNRFDANILEEIVIKIDNLDFISGNTSLHYCQSVLNEDMYNSILKVSKEKYDFIIIDLSSNIYIDSVKWALKESNRVLFVSEATNVCLKKTIQYIDLMTDIWGIYKEKINFIINKFRLGDIDKEMFSSICNLRIISTIKQNLENNYTSYESLIKSINYIPKNSLIGKIRNFGNMIGII